MADQNFHDAAYEATSRSHILNSLNHFLNKSMVLPPGDWHKHTLLPIVHHTKSSEVVITTEKRKKKIKEVPSYDPLQRQGRVFGGLKMDIIKRYPLYLSDFKDGFNLQCLAASIFVFFACLSPAVTFGGLLGEKTDRLIGVSEMMLATAICGTLFSLTSGQPLIIIGATGPVIIFEEALYKICMKQGIDFLAFRCWVGLWVSVICVVVVAVEGSVLVRYITRFTEEIFALLISLIFVYEVFKKLYHVFQTNPLLEFYPPCNLSDTSTYANSTYANSTYANSTYANSTYAISTYVNSTYVNSSYVNSTYDSPSDLVTPDYVSTATEIPSQYSSSLQNHTNSTTPPSIHNSTSILPPHPNFPHPNTALLTLILTIGTFFLALALKKFRNSHFLGRTARRAIGDFGVPISIVVMTTINLLIPNTYIEKLDVPTGLTPTAPELRGWFINPTPPLFSLSLIPLALIPSLLIFILLYIESVITSMIVNKKERCLKKGSGYHLDLFITGICACICGLMGLPFMCSATVRSLTHVSALSVFSRTHAPGDKPHLITVVEQRVSSLFVHLLIGMSILMGPVLRLVPLAVLFGIFLYMGVASMSGIQLLKRVKLMLIPVKHHPDVGYVNKVRQMKMHSFTLLQLLLLSILWTVKLTPASLAFPFLLILIVPFRIHIMKFFFSQLELKELDREEESDVNEEFEADFYTQAHMPV